MTRKRQFSLRRVYDQPSEDDGMRVLVDRLWPRGLSKDKAQIDLWLKEVAPSNALRHEFHGHPERWDAFLAAYERELNEEPARSAAAKLLTHLKDGHVTLLFAARDEKRNNAVALKRLLESERIAPK